MPKREVSGIVDVPFRQSVKYENSSVDLKSDKLDGPAQIGSPRHRFAPGETKKVGGGTKSLSETGGSYRCAPSDRAMNGRRDQSFSVAGSFPSSAMQCSISGPLQGYVSVSQVPLWIHLRLGFKDTSPGSFECLMAHRAWWKSITKTIGSCLCWTAMAPNLATGDSVQL